jgi:hypothetical protein
MYCTENNNNETATTTKKTNSKQNIKTKHNQQWKNTGETADTQTNGFDIYSVKMNLP